MATFTYPTNKRLVPNKMSLTAKTQASSFQSPFGGQTQVVQYSGQWWEGTLSYAPLFQADAEELMGFVNGLNGMVNTFYFTPQTKMLMSGSLTVTVNADGNTFTETGGQIGKFGIETTSYRLIQFTGTGSLFPRLPAGSHTISTSHGATFRLMTNDPTFDMDATMLYGTSLPIQEAL